MNPLFQLVATDFLFSGKDVLLFKFFLKPLLQLEGGQYVLKNIISATGNRFLQFFSDTDSNRSSFSIQGNRIFQGILHSGKWKPIFH